MFAPDIVTLRQFYATPLGQEAYRLIAAGLDELWPPPAKGDAVLGVGYAVPYLEAYPDQAVLCMPARQGASYWPPGRANRVFLAHESELPLADNSVNRILLLHSVENSEAIAAMIDDMWRVLTPGGRLLAVVPNRLGLWARSSRSPFGYGHPFSMAQLRDLITRHHFTLIRSSSALFLPPTRLRPLWRVASHIETAGKWLFPLFGGVLLVEAEKQVYASVLQPVTARKSYRMPLPATQPALGMKKRLLT